MTHLYLIRHGESYPNVEPIVGGMKGDRGLTPLGISQAERLHDRLAATQEIRADVLIASTLPRAQQTAKIIAPALGVPITSSDDVQEIRVGEADGLSLAEAHAKYGIPDFDNDPFRVISPGGESWPQFMLRVGSTIDAITREYAGKTIVIVCHGGFIDGSLIYFFGLPTMELPRIRFHTINTSITYWEQFTRRKTGTQHWRLDYYNDATHLREVGSKESILWEDVAPAPERGSDEPAVPVPTEDDKD